MAVLLWVPHRIREARLLDLMRGVDLPMPVATAVRIDDPASPIWALNSDPDHLLALHELPADPATSFAVGHRERHDDLPTASACR